MKKFLLSAFLLPIFIINLYSQSTLIPNPSFEEWEYVNDRQRWEPVYWIPETYAYQSSDAVDGLSSVGIDAPRLLCQNDIYAVNEYYEDMLSGKYFEPFYYITYWVKFVGFEGATIFRAYFFNDHIWIFDYNFCEHTWYQQVGTTVQSVVSGSWQQVCFPLVYNSDCNSLDTVKWVGLNNIYIRAEAYQPGSGTDSIGPGSIYIDHIELTATPPFTTFIKPKRGETFISGKQDTIKWDGGTTNRQVKLTYSTDGGANYQLIKDNINYTDNMYIWDVPDDLLTRTGKIILSDQTTNESLVESEFFTIKPYVITRIDPSAGSLAGYDVITDSWGFSNTEDEMWPEWWYNRFNYKTGIDPFTNNLYDQTAGGGIFASADSSDHPDWISFVRTFGQNACYSAEGNYNLLALQKWDAIKGQWGGSCFGIAVSNALAYEKYYQFRSLYPFFPYIQEAYTVQSDSNVIPVINELYTHQLGNPHTEYRNTVAIKKTPTETIEDIKQMLREEKVQIRTLSMISNSTDPNNQGGHAINVYKLEQDTVNTDIYYVYVWDNSYPEILNARIIVNTADNGGNGSWDPEYGWNGWEGDKWFYLRDPASNYLTIAVLAKSQTTRSPFILAANELEIYNTKDAYIVIKDNQGNQTGFGTNGVVTDIPSSVPLIAEDGSISPPYGYYLPNNNYSVVMNNFTADKSDCYLFSGNKSFTYERYGATNTQTDRLFFDGGLSVTNPDTEEKTIKLLNILSDTLQAADHLIVLRDLSLSQNDSVKIENLDDNKLKLSSYGSAKQYRIGLEYVSDTESGYYESAEIELPGNSSHIYEPVWDEINTTDLRILVDIGNEGTIDDTLNIENEVTNIGEEQGTLIPTEYRLEQNYPNPFNNSTVIRYSIPKERLVTLKVYNILGEEISTLVDETKQAGSYEITFNTEQLTSGVYFYRLQAGDYISIKKMLLLK